MLLREGICVSLTKIWYAKGKTKLSLRFFWSLSRVSSEGDCEVCAGVGMPCQDHGSTAAAWQYWTGLMSALSIPQPYLTGPTFPVWNKPMQASMAFQVPFFAWHHLFLLQRLQQAYSGCCPSNLSHRRSWRGQQYIQHNRRQLGRMDVLLKANTAKLFTNTIM